MKTKLILSFTALSALPATAVDRFWDGGDATSNMTAAANWNGNTVISPSLDQLIFPSGLPLADRTVNNNYAANTLFHRLQVNDSYTLGGTIMELDEALVCFHSAGTTVTVNAGLSLQGIVSLNTSVGNLVFGAGSQIYLNGNTATFRTFNATGSTTVGGLMAGSGQINVFGDGSVRFAGAKTFTAPVTVGDRGTLIVDHAGSLGSGAGMTALAEGTLELDSVAAISIPESLRTNNTGQPYAVIRSKGGAHTLTGPIVFEGGGAQFWDVQSTGLTMSGVVSSTTLTGVVIKEGPGRLTLSGAASNTADISIFNVRDGELLLSKSGGATAIPRCDLDIGDFSGTPGSAVVKLTASHQIADNARLLVYKDGVLNLSGYAETIDQLVFYGEGVVQTNGGTLRLNNGLNTHPGAIPGDSAIINGAVALANPHSGWNIAGDGNSVSVTVNGPVTSLAPNGILSKTGGGRLFLNGNVSVPLLEVTGGYLTHAGNSPATNLNCHGLSANLTGTTGDVTISGGSFQIGSLGSQSRQTLQCGKLSAGPGSTYLMMTAGAADSDAILVTGTVSLDQPGLAVPVDVIEPEPVIGEELIIIENDGTDPVSGNFAGYPEGAILTNPPSEKFVVSYKGGDGNDVSLTRIIAPTGVTRLWDGGGADNNWMTADNWNPNGQPQPGDNLVFPTVAPRKANTNNFPAGTTFNSITVHGTGYTLGGNGITLNEKVDFTSASGSHTLSLPITLALDATISVTGDGYVEANAPINLNGNKLTLHHAGGGDGDLVMSGVISGNTVGNRISKTGSGRVTWDNVHHTYSGATSVQAGSLMLRAGSRLGNITGSTTIDAGATLELRSTIDGGSGLGQESIFLQGRILVNAGAFSVGHSGIIEAAAETATIEVNDNKFDAYIITGSVLHKTGAGVMSIHLENTLTGGLFVDAGELRSEVLNGGCECPITIGAAGLPARFTLSIFNNQVSDNGAVLLMNPSAVFDIGGLTDTMGTLTMNGGTVTGTVAGRLTLGALNVQANAAAAVIGVPIANKAGNNGILQTADGAATPDLRLDGVVHGTGFVKTGAGRVDFMASIPLTGLDLLDIKEGSALFFNDSRYTDIHLNGGLLGGNGTVGNLSSISGGIISPGAGPGVLGGNIGTWNAAATLRMELNGPAPGAEYDQYFVNSDLNLDGTVLTLSVGAGFDPAPGTEFMIVRNVGGSPIKGTFAGIPQNGYVSTAGGKVFQLNYAGGDGDDAVLTRVQVGAPSIVSYSLFPGTEEHKGQKGSALSALGTPGLTYQLETSTNLQTWTAQQSVKADLQTGLMSLVFYNPETDPSHFLRVRLP